MDRSFNGLPYTAHHEAGHAVISYALGSRTIRDIRIKPDGSGEVRYLKITPPIDQDARVLLYEREVMISLAGPLAGARFYGLKKWDHWPTIWLRHVGAFQGEKSDLACIHRAARNRFGFICTPKSLSDYIRWATSHTAFYVSLHWSLIEAVAAALLERPFMSRAKFLDIVNSTAAGDGAVLKLG